jgi:hypothetical protein
LWRCRWPGRPGRATLPRPDPGRNRKSIVEAFGKLDARDVGPFIDDLVARRRVRDLEAIARSQTPFHWCAAAGLVKLLDADQAISYCTSLELDSMNWQTAFLVLGSHPKDKVIGYVKQLATSADPGVRYWCYKLCRLAKWPDLLGAAQRDLKTTDPVGSVANVPWSAARVPTLDKEAAAYIEACDPGKAQAPKK